MSIIFLPKKKHREIKIPENLYLELSSGLKSSLLVIINKSEKRERVLEHLGRGTCQWSIVGSGH